ncbi:MAG TPA: sugar phosphate isomerase/epimerase [Chloroflexota bacterium]|nr:sugar phosphate isomerase/epimerase [Chloroflexota bacterium]
MGRIRPTLHGSQLRRATLSLEEKAALAQRHGYPGLDFGLSETQHVDGGDPGAVTALLARYNVEPSTVGGLLSSDLLAPDEAFEAAYEVLPQRARALAAVGATRSGTVLWNRTVRPKEELWPLLVQRIRRVNAALDGTGVRLGMEFLGVKTLHPERPYAFIQSMAEANQLLDEAEAGHGGQGSGAVGLTLDSYHWYAAGDTLETIRQTPAQRLVLLHINDAKSGPRELLIDSDRLVPGEGVIPLAEWLQAIDATGFDGFVGMEVLGPRLAEVDAETSALVGIEAWRALATRAGLLQ